MSRLFGHLRREFGSVLGLELQRLHGIGVAALEPGLFGPTGPSQQACRAHEGGVDPRIRQRPDPLVLHNVKREGLAGHGERALVEEYGHLL